MKTKTDPLTLIPAEWTDLTVGNSALEGGVTT